MGTGYFVQHRIVSAFKRVEFVSDRMLYVVLRGHWYNIIVFIVHAPSEEKSDDSKDSFCEELEQVVYHFPKYLMKILLGEFNAKVGREDIFKPTIGNESLHQHSNDNGVTTVTFATPKIYLFRAHCSHTETFINTIGPPLMGRLNNQIDHILIDKRWLSSVRNIQSFRGADCDTYHCLVVPKVRERLTVSKQAVQKFDVDRFNLRKLSELEVRKQYQIKFSNRFVALENLNNSKDINMAGENIKESIKTSAKESLGMYEWK